MAGAGAVSTTGNALPGSCASPPEGSTNLASVFAIVHVSQRRSRSPRLPKRTGESSDADTPLISPGLQHASAAVSSIQGACRWRYSVAAPTPGWSSRTRVSHGDTSMDKEGKREICGIHGEAYYSLPAHGKNVFCSPSSGDADPEQESRLMMTTPSLDHGSRRTWPPPSGTGLHAWVA